MAQLTSRTELTEPADNDLLHIIDTSDTTDGALGTSKKIQHSNLMKGIDADNVDIADAEAHFTADNVEDALEELFETTDGIHGLAEDVNVLGNRNAAGEYVQRGTATNVQDKSSATIMVYQGNSDTFTFPVAFSNTPLVFLSCADGWAGFGTAYQTNTSSFKLLCGFAGGATGKPTFNYLALGT